MYFIFSLWPLKLPLVFIYRYFLVLWFYQFGTLVLSKFLEVKYCTQKVRLCETV